eukprot:403367195
MDNLLHAKFDSDEEDDDYIPDEDKEDKKNKNKNGKNDDYDSDKELTGVAGLKAQKRKKEIDDLWAMMNEEDDYYKSKSKQQKTQEKQVIAPAITQKQSNTSNNTTNSIQKQSANQLPTNKKVEQINSISINQDEEQKQLNQQAEKPQDEAFNAALEAIRQMKQKQRDLLVQDKVRYAGQTYQVERNATQKDLKQREIQDKKKLGGTCGALDDLVGLINDQGKNVNVVEKSKMDWSKYTKEEKLEAEFEKNRKDGYLAKKKFLDQVTETEYEYKKQIEKATLQQRK